MQNFLTAATVLKHRLPHSAKPHARILPQRGIKMDMDYIEVTGKTVADCITEACQKLSVVSSRLEYEIISEGSTGFLGFNVKPARIRARIREDKMEPQPQPQTAAEESAPQTSDRTSGAADQTPDLTAGFTASNSASDAAEPDAAEKEESPEYVSPIRWDTSAPVHQDDESEEESDTARSDSRDSRHEQRGNRRYGRGYDRRSKYDSRRSTGNGGRRSEDRRYRSGNDRGDESRAFSENFMQAAKDDSSPEGQQPEENRTPIPEEKRFTEEQIAAIRKKAEEFLQNVFHDMKMEVTVSMNFDPEWNTLSIDLSGDDMGILIGKRGQTLDSIQYLVSLVVNKDVESYIHVKADTENYRARRRETLEILARNIAGKVKRTRRPVELEPMNPYERRIIHSALQNDRYVTTHSEGEEPFRKVVISPKRPGYGSGYGYDRRRSAEKTDEE